MFRDSIPGINKIFQSDPPKGSIILVTGGAGTLKSSFIFSVMCAHLKKHPTETGVYTTLEETKDSHIRNMESIGIKCTDQLKIYDIASFKSDMAYEDLTYYVRQKDYIDLVLRGIFTVLRKGTEPSKGGAEGGANKPTCYALDSLNALHDLAKIDEKLIRQKIQELFFTLRSTGVTNFIVLETVTGEDLPEYYLADGVIELGMHKNTVGVKRYIQVKKMKAVKHALDPFVIDVEKTGGLTIVNPLTSGR